MSTKPSVSRTLNLQTVLVDVEELSAIARTFLTHAEPTGALHSIHQARLALDDAERLGVLLLRGTGASWQTVADTLGITRQAAHERFSRDI